MSLTIWIWDIQHPLPRKAESVYQHLYQFPLVLGRKYIWGTLSLEVEGLLWGLAVDWPVAYKQRSQAVHKEVSC